MDSVFKFIFRVAGSEAVTNAIKKVETGLGKMQTGLNKSASGFAKFAMAGTGIGAGMLTAEAAGRSFTATIKKIGTEMAEFAARGPEVAKLTGSFESITAAANQSADAMLAAGKEGTEGLISNMDLMAAANRGLLLGLPLTAKEFGTLTNSAVAMGQAMGRGPTEAINDLITGLGRGSPLILDNLGITIKAAEAYDKYAQTLGKTGTQLSDSEKKLAIYHEAMRQATTVTEQMGGIQITAAESVQRLIVSFTDFYDRVAGVVAQSKGVQILFQDISRIVLEFGDSFSVTNEDILAFVETLAMSTSIGLSGLVTGIKLASNAWALFSVSIIAVVTDAKIAIETLTALAKVATKPWKAKETYADFKKQVVAIKNEGVVAIKSAIDSDKKRSESLDKLKTKLDLVTVRIAANSGETVKNTVTNRDNKKTTDDLAVSAEKLKEKLALIGPTANEVNGKFNDLSQGIMLMTGNADSWGSALEDLTNKELLNVVNKLKELIDTGKASGPVFLAYRAAVGEAGDRSEYMAGQVGFATSNTEDNTDTVKEAEKNYSTWAEVIDSVASSLIDMGISAESGFGQVLSGAASAAMGMQNYAKAAAEGNLAGMISSGMTVLGGAAQVIKGVLGGKENWEMVADEVADAFGSSISESLAQTISDTSAQVAGLPAEVMGTFMEGVIDETDRYTASLMHLGDIMAEGLESGMVSVGNYKQGIADLFNEIDSGAISASQGLQALGDVWDQLAQQAEEGSFQARQMMVSMMQQAEATGQIPAQMQAAMEAGVDQMISGLEQVMSGLQNVGEAQGELFASTFWAAVSSKGLLGASDAMAGAWEELSSKGGPDLTGAMGLVGRLMNLTQTNEQFRGAAEAAQGLSEIVAGMSAANMITAESFNALGQTAQQAFDQALAGGASSSEAIAAILPYLAQAQQAAQLYGVELDENTQNLISQAEAAGYAFPADPMMVMVDLLKQIAIVLGAEIPESAQQAADAIADAGKGMEEATKEVKNKTDEQLPGIFDKLKESAEQGVIDVQTVLARLEGMNIQIPFELFGSGEIPGGGGFTPTKKQGKVTAAKGYGPTKLKRDTIIQAHAGEYVLVVPKGTPFAAKSAQSGMYAPWEVPEDHDPGPAPTDPGGGTSGPAPWETQDGGGADSGGAVAQLSENIENLTQSLEALAQQPQVSAQVALTPNINISQAQGQDPISLSNEIARELRANSVPSLKRAIRDISEGRV